MRGARYVRLIPWTLHSGSKQLWPPESQFSKHGGMVILRGKGDSRLSYSGIDEIPVSHLLEMGKCRKVDLI
jgi:hypothetical protein